MAALRDNPIVSLVLWLFVGRGCLPQSCEPQSCKPAQTVEQQHETRRRPDLEERLRLTKECEGCMLFAVRLEGADLRGARLKGAHLDGNMRGVDFRGADLTSASLYGDLEGADLRHAVLNRSLLRGSRVARARLDGADLRTLQGADAVDWSHAVLRGANMEGLLFYGSGKHRLRPPQHSLDTWHGGTTLRRADLRDANLHNAILSDCDLRQADLRGAFLDGARLPSDEEDLRGANFSGATGPWGLRCADDSMNRCVPVGSPEEFQQAKRRYEETCTPAWPCR